MQQQLLLVLLLQLPLPMAGVVAAAVAAALLLLLRSLRIRSWRWSRCKLSDCLYVCSQLRGRELSDTVKILGGFWVWAGETNKQKKRVTIFQMERFRWKILDGRSRSKLKKS